jgi:hypothetical protein
MNIRLLKDTVIDGKKHKKGTELGVTLARGRELVSKEKAEQIDKTKADTELKQKIDENA